MFNFLTKCCTCFYFINASVCTDLVNVTVVAYQTKQEHLWEISLILEQNNMKMVVLT